MHKIKNKTLEQIINEDITVIEDIILNGME